MIFDDIKANAVLDCGDFTFSRFYPEIVFEIKSKVKNIVISDISFCNYDDFNKTIEILKWWIKEYNSNHQIKSIIFENAPAKCIKNIERDKNRGISRRVEMVNKFSKDFNPQKFKINNSDSIRDI